MNLGLVIVFRILVFLSAALLLAALFKPHWVWPWKHKEPDRLVIVVVAALLFMSGFTGLGEYAQDAVGDDLERQLGAQILSKTEYRVGPETRRCAPGARPGLPGTTDNEETPDGVSYNVRTPVNYDATVAHPLLMVYAPYGKSSKSNEQFTYLTRDATAAGFIIAYANHRRMAPEALVELAAIPRRIQEKWCVDENRIFLTGHSDGGTISMGIAFVNGTRDIPAAIAPSAAGIRADDLAGRSCPKPLSVLVMHSTHDTLFPLPSYGKGVIGWWAKCNKCDLQAVETLPNGCVAYSGCANGVKTWYCENSYPHPVWPGLNSMVVGFLATATRTQP